MWSPGSFLCAQEELGQVGGLGRWCRAGGCPALGQPPVWIWWGDWYLQQADGGGSGARQVGGESFFFSRQGLQPQPGCCRNSWRWFRPSFPCRCIKEQAACAPRVFERWCPCPLRTGDTVLLHSLPGSRDCAARDGQRCRGREGAWQVLTIARCAGHQLHAPGPAQHCVALFPPP